MSNCCISFVLSAQAHTLMQMLQNFIMLTVFCLDITKMIPSVSAFQLVHIFVLHEVYFSTAWVETQKSPRMKIKEKKIKIDKYTLNPGVKNSVFTWEWEVWTESWTKKRGISIMSLLTCEINDLYISCHSINNQIWVLVRIRSWIGEQNCRDKESFTSCKSDLFFILNSSFKQFLFIIIFKCRKST